MRRWLRLPGRRGSILAVFSVMISAYAFTLGSPERAARLMFLYEIVPVRYWQILWWIVAVVAISRVYSRNDALAFCLLSSLTAFWSAANVVGSVLEPNLPGSWVFAAVWLGITIILKIVDGWVELPRGYLAD